MKENNQNKDTPFSKTPVGGCIRNISIIIILIVSGSFLLLICSIFVIIPIRGQIYIHRNTSIIEYSVSNQCEVSEYEAVGIWDKSSPGYYYDHTSTLQFRISCQDMNYPNGLWDCRCEPRQSD